MPWYSRRYFFVVWLSGAFYSYFYFHCFHAAHLLEFREIFPTRNTHTTSNKNSTYTLSAVVPQLPAFQIAGYICFLSPSIELRKHNIDGFGQADGFCTRNWKEKSRDKR